MTYSILAHDPETRQIGVAVQSHWFAVGAIAPWARGGVGAVATQANVEVSYGPRGLDAMEAGAPPSEVLAGLLEADAAAASRQVAIIDVRGRVAAHTGSRCIEHAGHVVDEDLQASAQANMMRAPGVPEAMLVAYGAAGGRPLAQRLLEALQAAEALGGDVRGRQSAGLLVVGGEARSDGRDRIVDLRVDDHADPVAELGRLVRLHAAYVEMGHGDQALARADSAGAERAYAAARELAGDNEEVAFWSAIAPAFAGEVDAAADRFARVPDDDGRWSTLIERLPAAGLIDEAVARRLLRRSPPAP